MDPEEQLAHDLVVNLRSKGVDAHASGAGVHWHVDAAQGARLARVHCFSYPKASPPPFEYLVTLHEGDRSVADGRWRQSTDAVVAAVRVWLSGADLEDVIHAAPFVDARRRAALAAAQRIDPSLRTEIGTDPSYELWVYGDGRSCTITSSDIASECGFSLGRAQIAVASDAWDSAVSAWLVDGATIGAMGKRGLWRLVDEHAELLESDPARWHWTHLLEWVKSPDGILAPLEELVVALSQRSVATAFYTFSSHSHLCFSASSHFPWVNDGLPSVVRNPDGMYLIGRTTYDLDGAVERIESELSTSKLRPFFGSWPHYAKPLVDAHFAQRGSTLRAAVVQRRGTYELRIERGGSARNCIVIDKQVTFVGNGILRSSMFETFTDALSAIVDFLG